MSEPTLTDFLLARIAEDEEEARKAIAERGRIDFIRPPEVPDMAFVAWSDLAVPAVVVGPERVLAECEAKRRIVDEHAAIRVGPEAGGVSCSSCQPLKVGPWPCPTLRFLALPYADHPDYRQERKP